MDADLKRDIYNLEITIGAAKERVEDCKRQAREADIREKRELMDLHTMVSEATVDQRRLTVILYILLGIFVSLWISMLLFGMNQVTLGAAAFVGVSSLLYFLIIATRGPYPVAARLADAERAKLSLKKKNHLAMLDEERRDAEEIISFQTAALEDMMKALKEQQGGG